MYFSARVADYFGLETYYALLAIGVLYISVFFMGNWRILIAYRRIKRLKQTMHERSALMGGAIYRRVFINDEGLIIERERWTRRYWTALSAF